jgi:alkylation response protein AidB-like acyl-CoA dehydrogenase
MDLRDSPDEAELRAGVRAWLDENLPAGDPREWSRKLYDAGYAGLTWPEEYGGKSAPYSHQAIVLEEFARAGAPQHMGVIGLGMAGPTIMAHGTEDQKRRYLPKIVSAEEIWCQGFSEPGAGSDLSAVRTRIDVQDGRFVVTGQKVWSSFAHIADHCILVGRSDPDSERHAGLTYLIVDMKAPGVEVRPLRQITGEAEFNEIFMTDVEVPRENLLGEIGGGWQVAMTTLLHERGTLGFALSGVLESQVQKLVALTKERGADDPIIRDRVAREWIELQALKFTNYRSLTTLMQTGIPGPEGSGAKLHWSEQNQRLTKLAMEILDGEDDGYWRHQQLRSRGNTIEAGTSEILRNIIAERVLGLPRSR